MQKIWTVLHVMTTGLVVVILLTASCEKPPPPMEVDNVLENLREGYQSQDAFTYTRDFAVEMYQGGNLRESYMAQVRNLTRRVGQWEDEKYLGEKRGELPELTVHRWKLTMTNDKVDLFVTLDENYQVVDLKYRL